MKPCFSQAVAVICQYLSMNCHLANFSKNSLRCFPMDPAEIEGSDRKMSLTGGGRLAQPFSPFCVPSGEYRCVGYLLRIPSYGGHWVSILPPSALYFNPAHPLHPTGSTTAAALMCDSMFPCPFEIRCNELELLLTACSDCFYGRLQHT